MKKITMLVALGVFVFAGVFSFASPAMAGGPIKGVIVKCGNNQGGIIATVTTDENGRFSFDNLKQGSCKLTFGDDLPSTSVNYNSSRSNVKLITASDGSTEFNITIELLTTGEKKTFEPIDVMIGPKGGKVIGTVNSVTINEGGVTTSDLGITNVGTLPTSPFYFFKEWKWGISRLFTFGAIAKAELELEITNEKAAEIIEVGKAKPDDTKAIVKALENYTKAQDKLKARLAKLTEDSENPKVAKLLEKVDEKTAKHLLLLDIISMNVTVPKQTQGATFGEKVNQGLYAYDNDCNDRAATPEVDDDCDGVDIALENAQKKTKDTIVAGAEKDSDVKQKAADQIARAEEAIKDVVSSVSKLGGGGGGAAAASYAATGMIVGGGGTGGGAESSYPWWYCIKYPYSRYCDDWGIANIQARLDGAKEAFDEGKYGQAFGQARSAEVIALSLHRGIVGGFKSVSGMDSETEVIENKAGNDPTGIKDTLQTQVIKVLPSTPKPRSIPENSTKSPQSIISFKECAAAGYPIMESYPAQCRVTETGKTFTQIITEDGAITPAPQKTEPVACTMQYDPVCGADGKTYGNSCEAGVAKIAVKYKGECSTTGIDQSAVPSSDTGTSAGQ